MTYRVQRPIPPFDYGSVVQWASDDGSVVSGSIYGFSEQDEGGPTAFVETSDGGSFEVPLSSLTLRTKPKE